MSELLDVVIVGGGLVGGLTALLLAQGGVQATVLDAAPVLDQEKTLAVMNPRVLALSQATIHLLKTVDVWDDLARQMPYSGMQVWNKNGYGEINFGHASEQQPQSDQALGSMVEPSVLNVAIQQKMLQQLKDYRTQVKVIRIEQIPQGWSIQLADGTTLKTKLLIGADGANSFVREQAYIDLDVLDYKQAAISCAIKTTQPNQYVARQIFLPTGPLAYLPMASLIHKRTAIGSRLSGLYQMIMPMNIQHSAIKRLCNLLTQESLQMLGEVVAVRSRAQFH
jgi:2-polyprenyl-6-methoxyphenol hydroxylase-like FAD-dependent oxidoreductase